MSQNKKKVNSRRALNERDILDMILKNDSEIFQNIQSYTIKSTNKKKIQFFQGDIQSNHNDTEEYPLFKRIRSSSVDLYKRHKREKKNQENYNLIKFEENPNKNTINDNFKNNKKKINNILLDKNILKENNNSNIKKEKKIKKVSFQKPKFITIIDVESYKKYNEDNTSKDPYDDLFKNSNDNNGKKDNENAKVVCSCFIF